MLKIRQGMRMHSDKIFYLRVVFYIFKFKLLILKMREKYICIQNI